MKGWGGMGIFGEEKKDEEDEFCCRECYEFNENLEANKDDEECEHCAKYLTLKCKHIEDFLDDEE
ncbi:MAG: hypothetical protein V1934_06085 [Methanobacteriota archaeon]